jgi:hypothetical protein
MPNSYTNNPLTGRQIRIGGVTFNQLIMDAYDFIDGRLIRRQNAPPLLEVRSYFNIDTGRRVRYGTRTYTWLIDQCYEIFEDYYLIPPHLVETAMSHPEVLQEEYPHFIVDRLEYLADEIDQQRRTARDEIIARLYINQDERHYRTLEEYKDRLAEINIELCRECFMPENPNELSEDRLCRECHVKK